MTIAANKVASIQYTVLDEEGQIIDSSEGGEPLVFLAVSYTHLTLPTNREV